MKRPPAANLQALLLLAAISAGCASAQDAEPGRPKGEIRVAMQPEVIKDCGPVPKPAFPPFELRGKAIYHVKAVVAGGRVQSTETTFRGGGRIERKVQRTVVQAIDTALRSLRCESDGSFEQVYTLERRD